MQILNRITLSACGMHAADQIALVCVPLVAAIIFNASAEIIGFLIAAQSMAHLIGSLPSGVIIDRMQSYTVAVSATLLSFFGFTAAALCVFTENLLGFGIAVMFAGFGIVLFVLVCLSILPKISKGEHLANANARIEMPRALASFAIPLAIGFSISESVAEWIFVCAALCSFGALIFTSKLPKFSVRKQNQDGVFPGLLQGGKFVLNNDLLLPISICALFWNMAFSALLVSMVPLLVDVYLVEPGVFGVAMSAFGLAATVGSWLAGRVSTRVPPFTILLFGPFCSVVASLALLSIPADGPIAIVYASFFVLGFGPSMWLITQNSIRQMVTPAEILGRVNAVIQTAVYGVRPMGALLGGAIVAAGTPRTGLYFVALCFTGSLATALFSRLRTVRRYSDLTVQAIK